MTASWIEDSAPVGQERHLYPVSPRTTNEDGGVLCIRVRVAHESEGSGYVVEECWANHPEGSSWHGAEPVASDGRVFIPEYSRRSVAEAITRLPSFVRPRSVRVEFSGSREIGFVDTNRSGATLEAQSRLMVGTMDRFVRNLSDGLELLEYMIATLEEEDPRGLDELRSAFSFLARPLRETADSMRGLSVHAKRIERIAEKLAGPKKPS